MLGRKQKITNDEWLQAVANIENLVPKEQLEEKINATIEDIKEKASDKKAAYAWSAGKDSIVLGALCEQVGISDCVLVASDLEYPAVLEWVQVNKPPKLEIVKTGQNLAWLANHPGMLFPQDSSTAAQWFHIVQHRGQAKYYKAHDLDILILGRRRADGNYVGAGSNIYTNNDGITRYSLLADWTHEEVLAYIHHFHLPLPPLYGWPNGYLCGTHPWPARQWTGSIENGWREIYQIDPSIVINAAHYLDSAKEFMSRVDPDGAA
mgnify:CR=1 FL=1